MKKFLSLLIVIIIIAAITLMIVVSREQGMSTNSSTATSTTSAPVSVSYSCNEGKTITAEFSEGTSTPVVTLGQPPVPTGSVALNVSDGRSMTLAQTISADGVRYANPDESFVFWTKGNGALVLENNKEQSYIGCIKVVSDPGNLPQVYENGAQGFSLRYPTGYTVNDSYSYQALGPGKSISGVKFTIPSSQASSTNLSTDSYISIEQIPQTQVCSAGKFLSRGVSVSTTTDNDTEYSFATSSDAGAGNRYEETVYAIPGTNPCIAIRYFIHYGNIDNYPPGTVTAFDKQSLINQFDAIRRTLIVNQ